MGLPAGVLAGAVAVGVRTDDQRWRAAGLGVTAAILVGEGVRALLRVADDATTAGWVVQVLVGVAVLVAATLAVRTPVARVVALATGIVGAVGVLGAYLLIGG